MVEEEGEIKGVCTGGGENLPLVLFGREPKSAAGKSFSANESAAFGRGIVKCLNHGGKAFTRRGLSDKIYSGLNRDTG